MTSQDQVTFGIACVGAVLGVLNTWRSFDRDSIRLLVSPAAYFLNTGDSGLCVEVINRSYLPVTVSEVGLATRRAHKGRFRMPHWRFTGCEGLPHRLEPRTAITVYFPPGAENAPSLIEARQGYAKTSCGRYFTGTSPALKAHIKKLRRAS